MKTAVITGATDGIGRQTALDLLKKGWSVVVHGRSSKKTEDTADWLGRQIQKGNISSDTKNHRTEIFTVTGDLSLVKNMPDLAEQIRSLPVSPDVLINNAGVFMNERVITSEGFEMTFVVNHLSHFALTLLLLDLLKKSDDPRIVNVSSIAHSGKAVDLNNLDFKKGFDGYEAYAMSKAANILFTSELARRLKTRNDLKHISVFSLHPGVVNTKLLRAGFGNIGRESLEEGAATSVYLATAQDISEKSGSYFLNCREHQPSPHARDRVLAEKFFNKCKELCNQAGIFLSDIL